MWNVQFTALAQGATLALLDSAPNHPDLGEIWRFVGSEQLTYFGAGAAFFSACLKAGIRPSEIADLSALRGAGSTGSPLTSEAYDWVYDTVKADIWLVPISGGTDLAGAFVIGNPMQPVRPGEMQCSALGNAVHAFDAAGNALIGRVGELVCTEPLPSMPLYFWGGAGDVRLKAAYFNTYPGIWRHGDWIEIIPDGAAIIYGRSDATINRNGLRLGSSEIYQAVEALPEVLDSLVVDLEYLGHESFMPIFVVTAPGVACDDSLKLSINTAIRTAVSPRFVPSAIIAVAEIPWTLSGKELEIPLKNCCWGAIQIRLSNAIRWSTPRALKPSLPMQSVVSLLDNRASKSAKLCQRARRVTSPVGAQTDAYHQPKVVLKPRSTATKMNP